MQSKSEHPEEGIWFERLVDGELNQEEYRRLLSSLDERPAGWKQCALAFLEAQALGHEVRGFGRDGDQAGLATTPPAVSNEPVELRGTPPSPAETRMSPWGMLGIAASFLVTLGVGIWMGTGPRDPGVSHAGMLSGFRPSVQGSALSPSRPAIELVGTECNRHLASKVELVVEGPDNQQQVIEVPVVQSDDETPRLSLDSSMPHDVREALERAGLRVVRQQQYIPVRLSDGRQMVLPIEEIKIVPAKVNYQ